MLFVGGQDNSAAAATLAASSRTRRLPLARPLLAAPPASCVADERLESTTRLAADSDGKSRSGVMQIGAFVALAFAWHPLPLQPASHLQHMRRPARASLPMLLNDKEDSGTPDMRDVQNDYIRSGGFIDGRPPDDLDKLSTFTIKDVEPVGQFLIGLSGILLLTLIGYLIIV